MTNKIKDSIDSKYFSFNKKTKVTLVILLLSFVSVVCLFSYLYFILNVSPSAERIYKIIEVKPGMGVREIGRLLEDNSIIRDKNHFLWLVKARKSSSRLKAGEYELNTNMKLTEVFDALMSGKSVIHMITIPEGYNIFQIADLLEEKGIVEKEKFIDLAFNKDFINSQGINSSSLEGYLFPDTYSFTKWIKTESIINKMINKFNSVMVPSLRQRAEELGFTVHEIITLASIIEKETGKEDERIFISAVYHNRLKKDMRLQCDPTVIYGLKDFDGNLTKKHLQSNKNPYNTYRKSGLPPGPIASPGEASIKAALYPADVNYLFFVSKNDGSHYFSNTLREHNKAVRIYQKNYNHKKDLSQQKRD